MADSFKKPLILVLEDEASWQTLIADILTDKGFTYEMTSSMEEFIAKFAKGKYSAVILDNRVKDGQALMHYDLARDIRREDPFVRIAFNSSGSFLRLAEAVGACELYKEPMKLRNFLREIKS